MWLSLELNIAGLNRIDEALGEEVDSDMVDNDFILEQETKAKLPFHPGEGEVSLQRRKCTDIKENRSVQLPDPLPTKYEARLNIREDAYQEIFKGYVEEKCGGSGRQKVNLSRSQQKGLAKLKKRVKEWEIVVCRTNKSGKFAVVTTQAYLDMGRKHTEGDMVISESEAKVIVID